jgi:hypothetical protein
MKKPQPLHVPILPERIENASAAYSLSRASNHHLLQAATKIPKASRVCSRSNGHWRGPAPGSGLPFWRWLLNDWSAVGLAWH